MTEFFSPDDYILSRIAAFPSLYCSDSYEASKIKVLDQLLNVIGNGIRDDEELDEELIARPFDKERAMRICNGEPVFYGYFEVEDFGDNFKFGRGDSITALESEQADHPTVVHWMEASNTNKRNRFLGEEYRWNPYPNFQKQYSTVWQTDFKKLGPEWAKAVVWFYTKCQEYFAGDHSSYHGAFPSNLPAKDEKLIQDMMGYREKYKSDKEFSDMYLGAGVVYAGDMNAFLLERWAVTRANIDKFIVQTIKKFS